MGVHKSDEDFEAEHDLRSLIEAEKVRNDKPRLKRAMVKAKEQMAALKKVENS